MLTMEKIDAVAYAENGLYRLRILHDDCAPNPLTDFDCLGKVICWHRNRELGHPHCYRNPRHFLEELALEHGARESKVAQWRFDELLAYVRKHVILLEIWAYEHGSIVLRTSEGGNPFPCSWDSYFVGYTYVTKADAREEYGRLTRKRVELIKQVLKSEIDEYSEYVNGNVYAFVLEKKCESPRMCGQYGENEMTADFEVVDSCGGFFGCDPFENGMSNTIPAEHHTLLRNLQWV